ncbi:hypothetical protein ING2E5B_1714 [Fermentimonas caenicola]|jgi:hypothetical protein|uniref:Uncharacterized protein n=1 Tax=Fermentimonas caenicola TaxID=1562970 RepID=A0A098C0Q4_9BACT|nr:hypothetical protein ING2E5B_1714 [Fermentimonas caenicola]
MNNKTIEDLSTSAVIKSIALTGILSPFINSDDKEPSFDGKVIIHSDKKGTKE